MNGQQFPNQTPSGGYASPLPPIPPHGNRTNQPPRMSFQSQRFPYAASSGSLVPQRPPPILANPRFIPPNIVTGQGLGAYSYQLHATTSQQPVSGISAIAQAAPLPPPGPYGSMIPGNINNSAPTTLYPPPPTAPLSMGPPQKRRRPKGTACDQCRRQHQPCDGERPRCPRCIRTHKICTHNGTAKRPGPKPQGRKPLADHVLGAVIRSNPQLERLIIHELQHGIQPGTDVTNLECLQDVAARSTLQDAFTSSQIFQLACAESTPGGQGAAGALPTLPSFASSTVAPVAAPGLSIATPAATPDSADGDDSQPSA